MVAWLAQNPAQRDEFVADPTKLPGAIEELLRWDQPNHNGRIVRKEVEIHGVTLRPGDRVMMLLAAIHACRRPRDRPLRPPGRSLACPS